MLRDRRESLIIGTGEPPVRSFLKISNASADALAASRNAWKYSFDHLVGAGEERGRDRDAERLRGLQIDAERVTLVDFDGKFTWPCALQNTGNVSCGSATMLPSTSAIANQRSFCDPIQVLSHDGHPNH